MESIGAHAVTGQFRQDVGSPGLREVVILEHHHTGAFARDKPVAGVVEGPRGPLRLIVTSRESLHVGETGETQRGNGRFCPARHHGLGIAALDDARGLADGMVAGGAGGGDREVGSLETVPHRHHPRTHVDDQHRNQERRDAPRSLFQKLDLVGLGGLQTSDAAADQNAHLGRIEVRHPVEPALGHRLNGGGDRKVDIGIGAFDILLGHPGGRIEVLDLGGDPNGEGADIELGDQAASGFSGGQTFPERINPGSDGSHGSHSCDDNSFGLQGGDCLPKW